MVISQFEVKSKTVTEKYTIFLKVISSTDIQQRFPIFTMGL